MLFICLLAQYLVYYNKKTKKLSLKLKLMEKNLT